MYKILPTHFYSNNCKLDVKLYLPDSGGKTSVVIMAHGFGARMDWGLHPFADTFANMGFTVLMFDYRGWCIMFIILKIIMLLLNMPEQFPALTVPKYFYGVHHSAEGMY